MPILGASSSGAKPAPTVPTSVSASNSGSGRAFNNGAASVSFTAPTTSKLPVTSYTVTSSPGSFTASGASSPLTVTGLQSNTAYTYTVTATSAAGTSSASSASSSVTATTVPAAPTIGTPTAGTDTTTQVNVAFTAPATGGSAITSYTATSSPGGLTGTGSSSPVTVSGLSPTTAYTFTVTATNANGTSAASSASSSITTATPTSFESIATFAGSGQSSVTFSSIPSTYKALQIRIYARGSTGGVHYGIRPNSDATSSYSNHVIESFGSGTNAGTSGVNDRAFPYLIQCAGTADNGTGAGIIDIIDYSSSTKTKTLTAFLGTDLNNVVNGRAVLATSLYNKTDAITSIQVVNSNGTFSTGCSIALYGVR
jgi:trimeric autotransporter adhesin